MDQLVRVAEHGQATPADPPEPSEPSRRDRVPAWLPPALLVAALLALYLTVQFRYLRAPWPQDALTYFEKAAAFPDVATDHWSLRIGLVLPLRALQEVFGYSEAAYYTLPLAAGAVLVLSTYWLGRMLFATAVGVAGAVLLLLSDAFLESSSVPLPDHLATALFTLALALVVYVATRRGPPTEWGRLEHGALLAAGFLLGWSYLTREFIAFVFPVVVVVFHAYRLPWRKLMWVAAPAAALLVGELATNWIIHGSPLARFTVSGSHGGQRDFVRDSRLDALLRFPRALRASPGGDALALLFWLMPVTLLVGRRSSRGDNDGTHDDGATGDLGKRSFRVVGTWFFAFWVPITLGTGLVVPSFRFIIGDYLRYWAPLLPALVLGGLALVHHVISRVISRVMVVGLSRLEVRGARYRWLPAAGVLLLAGWIGVVVAADARDRPIYTANGGTQMREVRSWLEDEGQDVRVIVTDRYTARLLPIYAPATFGDRHWRGEIRVRHVRDIFGSAPLDDAAVILHRFTYEIPFRGYLGLPADGRDPLPGWDRVTVRPDGSLLIYRSPD